MKIPMSLPDITDLEIDVVNHVMSSHWLSRGPWVSRFEESFAAYIGAKHAIAVSSGTSGLHLAVIAAGVGSGDEVITPSFSFISTANCVLYERAEPVFVDIDPATGNIAPAAIEAAITPRTKAIIVVHVFGQPADMDPIRHIAQRHHLYVIEDACEAVGAHYKGRRVGTLSDAAVFAFYPNKQITTGEGGIIVTDNDHWADLFRSLRNQGRDEDSAWLSHQRLGYNYRMDELSAALGWAQMQRIEDILAKRSQVADWYNQRLDRIPGVHPPTIVRTTTRMSWFVYVVRLDNWIDRNTLMARLETRGIPSRCYFDPIHSQPFYAQRNGNSDAHLVHTVRVGATSLALPFSSIMSESEVAYVCQQLRAVVTDMRVELAGSAA